RRFTAGAGALDFDFEGTDAMFGGLLARILGAHLRRVRGRFAAALEAHHAGARPGNRIALRVGDGDHRVVEGRVDVGHTRRDILAFAPAKALRFTSHDAESYLIHEAGRGAAKEAAAGAEKPAYFFLPAIGFALPLRVRALVCVRWPRTGRPLR